MSLSERTIAKPEIRLLAGPRARAARAGLAADRMIIVSGPWPKKAREILERRHPELAASTAVYQVWILDVAEHPSDSEAGWVAWWDHGRLRERGAPTPP